MNKIGLLIIATNKYSRFLESLIMSADKYFLNGDNVTYYIYTDQKDLNINTQRKLKIIPVVHKEWPWMTLGRYKMFGDSRSELMEMDFLFYCDADMRFCDNVGEEILSTRVATQHPGFKGGRGTPETRAESLACVHPHEHMQYFAGGFNGGDAIEFLKMSDVLSVRIADDYERGIIAIWHDESHMNRYFIDNPPTKILDSSYCHIEGTRSTYKPKLIALIKNHRQVRI